MAFFANSGSGYLWLDSRENNPKTSQQSITKALPKTTQSYIANVLAYGSSFCTVVFGANITLRLCRRHELTNLRFRIRHRTPTGVSVL